MESVSTHVGYFLWCSAILNCFYVDIAPTFDINDENLKFGNLVTHHNFLFHVSMRHNSMEIVL